VVDGGVGISGDVNIAGALTASGSVSFTGDGSFRDLTVTGNDLNFGNGATIVNTSSAILTITEENTVLSGDLKVTGNDIQGSAGSTALTLDGTNVEIFGDLTLSAGADGALQFTNAGENSIKIPNNQASALIIEENNNAYMTFVSTTSSELVQFNKAASAIAGLTVGANGDEFSISEALNDATLASLITDKDMIFKVNDGGSATEVFRLDGDVSTLMLKDGKKMVIGYPGLSIHNPANNLIDINHIDGGAVSIKGGTTGLVDPHKFLVLQDQWYHP
jgi:hypothetical protein